MATQDYMSNGSAGLKRFLESGEWAKFNETELTKLVSYVSSMEEDKSIIESAGVKSLLMHIFGAGFARTAQMAVTLSCAYNLCLARTDRRALLAEVVFLSPAFSLLVNRRGKDLRKAIDEQTAKLVLKRARRGTFGEQQTTLANLKALVGEADNDNLPSTAESVQALRTRLMHSEQSLLDTLINLGVNRNVAHTVDAASVNVSSLNQLNRTLRLIGHQLRAASDETPGEQTFLYDRQDIRSLVSQCIDVVCLENGSAGAALAYHLRKATGIMINVLDACEDSLDTGRRMLLLDPLELVTDERVKSKLEALLASGQVVIPSVVSEFSAGINAYELAILGLRSSEDAHAFLQTKLSEVNANADAMGLSALPSESSVLIAEIAILVYLLTEEHVQAAAHVANTLTTVLPVQDLIFYLWEAHSTLAQHRDLSEVVWLVDGSEGGSGLLVSYLYRQVTGIGSDQFVTLTRALKKDKFRMKALKARLAGKQVVIVDDCSMTGNQLAELVAFVSNNFAVTDISVIASVATAQAKAKLSGICTEFVVGQEVADIRNEAQELFAAMPEFGAVISSAVEQSRYGNGSVITGMVLPHMVPNNTGKWLYALLTQWLDLPAAHSEKCVVKRAA